MNKEEMIRDLSIKFNISNEEAEKALEQNKWNFIETVIFLEKNSNFQKVDLSKDDFSQNNYENVKDKEENKSSCFSELLGRFARFCTNMIKKGNANYFEFGKDGQKPCKMPITALVILLIIAFWPIGILLVVGLFCGYKYSFYGPNIKSSKPNDFMNKAYNGAQNMKNDFNKGYNNN